MVSTTAPLLRLSHPSLKNLSESSLLRSFDLTIHAHSVYLYFLDNSTLRLLVRFIFQVNILSPKSPLSAFASIDLPVRRATILLFVSFLAGFIPHLLFAVPAAGEPTLGYLHGGLLIDFVGQHGPISRLRLLAVDVIIFILQLTMLAITASTTPSTLGVGTSAASRTVASADLDRAERGLSTPEDAEVPSRDEGYENIVVRVGVIETIRSLWDSDRPLVRRFR